MAAFDVDGMLERFKSRAAAVRERGVPPIEGSGTQAVHQIGGGGLHRLLTDRNRLMVGRR